MKVNGFIKNGKLELKGLRIGQLVITTRKSLRNINISDATIILFEQKKQTDAK